VPFLSPVLLRESDSVNIATFHAFAGYSVPYLMVKRALRGTIDRLDGRIAVSAAARHFIDRYFPADYKVIPNGVDLRRYRDVPPFARYRDGTANILFVGRFEERKGLIHLLKAFRVLKEQGWDARLLVVGAGPQEREVRRYIATRRLRDVHLLGRVSDHDKARYFATADIYVSPATGQESFGIVLLEAMASGTSIVCSDIHGYKGVVRRGEQALLVPPRDRAALVAAMAKLLADPLERARMGASGRERARQFSWESITAKVDDYYGFVVRRLAAQGALPPGYRAPVPPAPVRMVMEPDPARRVAVPVGTGSAQEV
jgi:phosphatidylinositol alpha-mannosyltransferase